MPVQMLRLGIVQLKQIQFQLILIQDVLQEEPHIHNSMTGTETEFQTGMTLMMTMMVSSTFLISIGIVISTMTTIYT